MPLEDRPFAWREAKDGRVLIEWRGRRAAVLTGARAARFLNAIEGAEPEREQLEMAREEEWLIVVSGRPTLRTPDGESELAPGEVAFFERGPGGAHKVTNRTAEDVRVLMFSDIRYPSVSAYPDGDKVGVHLRDRSHNLIVRRESNVDYYDGEV